MRAVIYARYSSDLQREASIDDQLEVCRRYADGAGLDGGRQLHGCGAERRQPVPAGVPEADGGCRPSGGSRW